ncbi:MAG: hypothetical protein IJ139_10490 [Bacteroidaceae bacterium]|nr:hypothetical protein [Bacteroidaceae bacterium]
MKKLSITLVLMTLVCGMAFAQKSFNSTQKQLRDNILSYIKAEGFQPTIDDDGDIKFKRQGDVYFVIIGEKDTDPMYVTLTKYYSYGTSLTKTKVTLAATEINKYKMCKLYVLDDSFKLNMELYLKQSSAFTSIFYKLLDIMDSAEEEISDL